MKAMRLWAVMAIMFCTGFSLQAQSIPGPLPTPLSPPAYGGRCFLTLCEGDIVFNLPLGYRKAVVVGIERQGTFILRFLESGLVGGRWAYADLARTRGCSGRHCVGESVYNVARNYRVVQIMGIQADGRFIVQFLDGAGLGGNWDHANFAKMYGCGRFFCVGHYAVNVTQGFRPVQIIGIEFFGTYVLRFQDNGTVGGHWSDNDLR